MEENKKDICAFPSSNEIQCGNSFSTGHAGMTLRDYFAGKAMQGIMSCESTDEVLIKDYEKMINVVATGSYLIADAMMEARKK